MGQGLFGLSFTSSSPTCALQIRQAQTSTPDLKVFLRIRLWTTSALDPTA